MTSVRIVFIESGLTYSSFKMYLQNNFKTQPFTESRQKHALILQSSVMFHKLLETSFATDEMGILDGRKKIPNPRAFGFGIPKKNPSQCHLYTI